LKHLPGRHHGDYFTSVVFFSKLEETCSSGERNVLVTDSEIIDIDGIGSVLFERSRRSRRINITIKPFRGIRVAVPFGVSFKAALKFVRDKQDWVGRHLVKMEKYERRLIKVPAPIPRIDKASAERILTRRLRELADEYGFAYNRVTIRNQRTRWGSCSHNNNISLNMKLMRLPDELVDYVLLHELVHTRVHNHGSGFWRELEKYVPGARSYTARLRRYDLYLL
jgi:predicted metal-dependent hydrolase